MNNELNENNLLKQNTGLDYDIWIDKDGVNGNYKHHEPRIKVIKSKNDKIPVSISKQPEILVNREIPKFRKIRNWVIKYYDALIQTWFHEINYEELQTIVNIHKKNNKDENQ